jgi:DNA ligase-1
MDDLKDLQQLVTELNATNSTLDKMATLKKFPQCKKILRWTYDPFKQYYVSSDNLKKNPRIHTQGGSFPKFNNIYDLLYNLDVRTVTGHEALAAIWYFIDHNDHTELIFNILDRNLKTRADAKLINKVWPGTVPSFEVALANKYSDVKDKVDFKKDTWFASRKLDGVRVITIIKPNLDIQFLSRKGKEFTTLDKVKQELKKKFARWNFSGQGNGLVIDGEMCIVDKNGDENFADMIKLIRRKDFTIENPKYKIFDLLLLDTFEGTGPLVDLSNRIDAIKALMKDNTFDGKILDPVEQIKINSVEELTIMTTEATKAGWEGLIIRKDVPYEGKRSNNMLKVKEMQDAEFVVQDAEMGPIRIIKNGKEVTETMLSAIKIPYKGNIVSVGSGFSMDQRKEFYEDPSKIIGKTVLVKYFEETTNEKGDISLRFPIFVHLYGEERDT